MIKNAKISSTFLGRESHGILTFYLTLKGDGWGIAVGGYALDEYSEERECRVAHEKGLQLIDEVLKVVGVDSWEQLNGQYIRVETAGLGQIASKIGNLVEDRWIDFKEFFE